MTAQRPRHFLVVATQCDGEDHLPGLDTAAMQLSDMLAAPDLGAATGELLLHDANDTEIRQAVRAAADRAAAEGAVLILAFLGHGFLVGDSTLYYMAHNTEHDKPTGGIDIGALLGEVVQHLGIEGVLAVLDTCHSGAGVPDVSRIVGGVAQGRTDLAVLMSSAANQRSYDMAFTFALTRLVRTGIGGTAELLFTNDLIPPLRASLTRQKPAQFVFGGENAGLLWLARNRTHASSAILGSIGRLGRTELESALDAWDPGYPRPAGWSTASLGELRAVAALSTDFPAKHVVRVVDAITLALSAADLIRTGFGEVSTRTLRCAAQRARVFTQRLSGSALVVELLEQAALRVATVGGNPWQPLVELVTALAIETGTPACETRLREWAQSRGLVAELNDAYTALAATPTRSDPKLVLVATGKLAGWPKSVRAWLLRPGTTTVPQKTFTCPRPSPTSAEQLVVRALAWAHSERRPGENLRSVDIAVPTNVLADWNPREVDDGQYLLGARHSVLTQWNGRLQRGQLQRRMNDSARDAVHRIDNDPDVPIDWVTQADLRDVRELGRRLKLGGFPRAIGIDHRPANLTEVLDLLLQYSPVLLWPSAAGATDTTWQDEVRKRWDALPGEFTVAFREQANGRTTGLLSVRTAWHDADWLEFCRWFDNREVRS
ncbi:caspase family protein [Kibdelosporangium phytohabitans]|uniref:Uncharacterized protein n=1 Tax=Kibdelosporangium phytohabitans TaxID=860235 RepID=A0A0N9HSL6_9PSEU|nr:caspase family protein [Kibdelosporangium phytohabitans]ALG06266.1 hypothetical protein AOZ06_04375 [Kibdelosporangium phytohabitans]MBE1467364.1 hypothetical protein [Kibdelosporangium phytohabitans]